MTDKSNNQRTENNLFMNGPEVFNFTLRVVPGMVDRLLEKAGVSQEQIDLWVFHQANQYMLEHLRKKLHVPESQFVMSLADCGNTVSSTIPIALKRAAEQGRLLRGHKVGLVGFGVGYSWAGTIIAWG
jgi:3-oxoacyl-[acyl-carrier-protein] synthase-3